MSSILSLRVFLVIELFLLKQANLLLAFADEPKLVCIDLLYHRVKKIISPTTHGASTDRLSNAYSSNYKNRLKYL